MWALSSIRTLFANINIFLAEWISKIYSFIIMLADVQIVNETVKAIIERIYVVMGLFMLFKLVFVIINFIIEPDKQQSVGKILIRIVVSLCLIPTVPIIFEKAYELQGIILKNNVIGKIVLGNSASLDEVSDDLSKAGDQLSYLVFSNFVDYNRESTLSKVFEGCPNIFLEEDNSQETREFDYCTINGNSPSVPICAYYLYYAPYSYPNSYGEYPDSRDVYYSCKDGTKLCYDCGFVEKFSKEDIKNLISYHDEDGVLEYFEYSPETISQINNWTNIYNQNSSAWTMLCGIRDGKYIYDLINYGRDNYSVKAILSEAIISSTEVDPFFYSDDKCDAKNNETKGDGDFVFSFNFIFSTIVALAVIFFLIVICFDVSVRSIKLAFLETFAPIPIVSYVDIKSSKLFNSWVKECINTFLQLFIRLAIVFFTVLLFKMLLNSGSSNPTIVNIFLIIGVLLFAFQMPKLLSQLFNLNGNGFLSIIKDSVKFTVGVGAIGASIAVGVASNALHTKENVKSALNSPKNVSENIEKLKNANGVVNKLSAFGSTLKSIGNVPLSFVRIPGNIVTGGLSSGLKTAKKLYDNKGTYKSGDVSRSIRENIYDNEKKTTGISSMSQNEISFELNELKGEKERVEKEFENINSNIASRLSGESNYHVIKNIFEKDNKYSNYNDYVTDMAQSGNNRIIDQNKFNEYKELYDAQKQYETDLNNIKKRIKLLEKYLEKK